MWFGLSGNIVILSKSENPSKNDVKKIFYGVQFCIKQDTFSACACSEMIPKKNNELLCIRPKRADTITTLQLQKLEPAIKSALFGRIQKKALLSWLKARPFYKYQIGILPFWNRQIPITIFQSIIKSGIIIVFSFAKCHHFSNEIRIVITHSTTHEIIETITFKDALKSFFLYSASL